MGLSSRRALAAVSSAGLLTLAVPALARDGDPGHRPAHLALERLEREAVERWSGSFAGLWVEPDGSVEIAFTRDAHARVAELSAAFSEPERLVPLTHAESKESLQALADEVAADREAAQDGGDLVRGVPGGRFDIGIDDAQNAVYVVLEDASPAARRAFADRYEGRVVVREGPLYAPSACTRGACGRALRGGLRVFSASDVCTSAFALRPARGGRRQLATAAHCNGNRWFHGPSHRARFEYGAVRRQQLNGRVDAERHAVGRPFGARPAIFVRRAERVRQIRRTINWRSTVEGTRVCKAGLMTGRTCGVITDKDVRPNYVPPGTQGRYIRVDNACAVRGDSGSPVFRRHTAYGILSGSRNAPINEEDRCLPASEGGESFIFSNVRYVERALNARVVRAR